MSKIKISDIWGKLPVGKPALVLNPLTEKINDVEPFFRFAESFGGFESCYELMDHVTQSLATAPLIDGQEDTEHQFRILEVDYAFKLRDMFKELRKCEIFSSKNK